VPGAQLPGCLVVATPLIGDGLGCMLRMHWDVQVCPPEEGAVRAGLALRPPDIAIVDLVVSHMGAEAAQLIRRIHPRLPMFCTTNGHEAPSWMHPIDVNWSGGRFLTEMRNIRASLDRTDRESLGHCGWEATFQGQRLSERERQVLRLLGRGAEMKVVARLLGITARTVAFHKYNIMERHGLRTNVDFLAFFHTTEIDSSPTGE
jgi:DNA-binding NarL/FixJ family response regulator